MRRLLIMACSVTKNDSITKTLHALHRYDGPAYRILRAWLNGRDPLIHCNLNIYILSALHGLIPYYRIVHPYDRHMTDVDVAELETRVRSSVETFITPRVDRWASAHVHGGQLYKELLRKTLPSTIADLASWSSGGIGQQNQQLKHWLEMEAL